MRLLLRLVVVLIASLAAWLGSGTPLALGTSTSSPAAYAYDSQHHTSVMTRTMAERAPPVSYDHTITAYNAVDHSSHGASARQDCAAPPLALAYDNPLPLVQVARIEATTRGLARSAGTEPRALQGTRRAAKTADDWPTISGIVRDASRSKGNFGLGSARIAGNACWRVLGRRGLPRRERWKDARQPRWSENLPAAVVEAGSRHQANFSY